MMPGQVGMIFGPSNVGKSTVVASICAHIAQGLPLADVQTQKSLVLYIAAEDPKGVEDRALPHLLNVPSDAHSFYVFPKAVDLTDTDQMGRLAYEIADLMEAESASSCLVVFDTMAMSIGDGDENSSRDMARVIQNLRRLAEGTGIHALLVHHTGVSDTTRPRGSGTVFNAFDTVMLVEDAAKSHGRGMVSLTLKKQRNGSKNSRLHFRLSAFPIGVDRDGEPITLPIARPIHIDDATKFADRTPVAEANGEVDFRSKIVRRLVEDLCKESPQRRVKAADIFDDFAARCAPESDRRETVLRGINRIFAELVEAGEIEGDGKQGYRTIVQNRQAYAS